MYISIVIHFFSVDSKFVRFQMLTPDMFLLLNDMAFKMCIFVSSAKTFSITTTYLSNLIFTILTTDDLLHVWQLVLKSIQPKTVWISLNNRRMCFLEHILLHMYNIICVHMFLKRQSIECLCSICSKEFIILIITRTNWNHPPPPHPPVCQWACW